MTSEYRKVSVKLPKNRRFRSVDHRAKLVYYYAISNPLSNSAGCYEINPSEMGFDLAYEDRAIHRAIEDLSEAGLVSWDPDNEVLLIERALKHWPITNSKHAAGAISRLLELPDCPLRSRRISELLEQDKLSEEQKGELQGVLGKAIKPDSPIIDLSPSRPRTRPKSKPRPELEQSPPKPPKGVEKTTKPENPVLKGEVLDARQGGSVTTIDRASLLEGVEIWNVLAKRIGRPIVQKFGDKRKRVLMSRYRDAGGIQGWRTACEKVEASAFLCNGTPGKWPGVTFDWLSNPSNFTKVMEGNFDESTNDNGNTPTSDPFTDAFANA